MFAHRCPNMMMTRLEDLHSKCSRHSEKMRKQRAIDDLPATQLVFALILHINTDDMMLFISLFKNLKSCRQPEVKPNGLLSGSPAVHAVL